MCKPVENVLKAKDQQRIHENTVFFWGILACSHPLAQHASSLKSQHCPCRVIHRSNSVNL